MYSFGNAIHYSLIQLTGELAIRSLDLFRIWYTWWIFNEAIQVKVEPWNGINVGREGILNPPGNQWRSGLRVYHWMHKQNRKTCQYFSLSAGISFPMFVLLRGAICGIRKQLSSLSVAPYVYSWALSIQFLCCVWIAGKPSINRQKQLLLCQQDIKLTRMYIGSGKVTRAAQRNHEWKICKITFERVVICICALCSVTCGKYVAHN